MNSFNLLKSVSVFKLSRHPIQPNLNCLAKRFRRSSQCDICLFPPDKRPCFDHRNLTIEKGHSSHAKLIKAFLFSQYWPREPSVVGLWMSQNCAYLDTLSDKYANSGDRFLAFEFLERTREKKLVGVSVANKIFPWCVNELEEWAHYTISKPERYRLYFSAHCIKSPNLFAKYNVTFIYDVEILGTVAEVAAQGVATRLLMRVLQHADELRYPLVQVVSVNQYASKICEACGMKREWCMKYSDYVDNAGQNIFYPRLPHHSVSVYVKYFDPGIGHRICEPPYLLH